VLVADVCQFLPLILFFENTNDLALGEFCFFMFPKFTIKLYF
jgi:hypothetical protein